MQFCLTFQNQSGMGVMGRPTRFDSIPYSIGLPYSYTKPSCTRPTSSNWLLPAPIDFCCFPSNTFGLDALYHSVCILIHEAIAFHPVCLQEFGQILSIVLCPEFCTLTNNFQELSRGPKKLIDFFPF